MITSLNTGVRFQSRRASSFPYRKYADLMVDYSIGGIRRNEKTVIALENQRLKVKTLDIVRQLYQQGYLLSVNVIPARISFLMDSPKAVTKAFIEQEEATNKQYNHALTIYDISPESKALTALTQRTAEPNETIRLTILSNDNDRLAEEITRKAASNDGLISFIGGNQFLGKIQIQCAVRDEQLAFIPPERRTQFETMSKYIFVRNPYNETDESTPRKFLKSLPTLDDAEIARPAKIRREANTPLSQLRMTRMRRIEQGRGLEGGFFRTLGNSPTHKLASDAGMTLNDYGRFYKQITNMHRPNPVTYYRKMDEIVGHYASQLQKFHTLRVYRDDGQTDVTFSIRDVGSPQSRYVASSTATGNALPAEIFTSPVEDSVNGRLFLDLPCYLDDEAFEGIHLTLKDGKIIDLTVDKGNEEWLKARVVEGHDPNKTVPGFNRLGEFAIGFNRKITELLGGRAVKDVLVAEKQDLHFALGDSYTVCGGQNTSSRHDDISARSGPGSGLHIEGLADGMSTPMAIYDNGRFSDAFLTYQSDKTVENTEFFDKD